MAIQLKAANLKVNNNSSRNAQTEADPALEGVWLNIGVQLENGTFIRLPLGVPVSNLSTKPIYANSDPDYAMQVQVSNQLVEQLKAKGMKLTDGEDVNVDMFTVKLYKSAKPVEVSTEDLLIDLKL